MSSKEKANLARIRDNQRRSRARRKEYLQELEARLRQCELQGIEASSEIQMAARRVAEENKKLRGLLAQHGVGEDTIETYLETPPTTDSVMGGQYGSSSAAVQLLEQLLQTRKTFPVDGNTVNLNIGGGPGSRASSASLSTVQSLWDPIYSQNTGDRRRSGTLQSVGKAASSAHQFMTPSTSSTSQTSSVSLGHGSNRGVPIHPPRLTPVQMPRNPGSSNRNQQMYDFDSQLGLSNPSQYSSHQRTAEKHLQPHTAPQRSSVYIPTTSSSNVNNCNYATEMITTMAGADASAVRHDLGCMPGMDCEVDNQLVFNVMDRYTGSVGL
ncbi:hypothetical protein N431DRAFT_425837 [Stipitochalara longipes BDJ]|nr:hypothetical protein N431DRAFT_425837 [Stipitochalara longipes BDJ]